MPFDPHTTTLDELVQATLHVAEERYGMLTHIRARWAVSRWGATMPATITPAQWLAWIECEATFRENVAEPNLQFLHYLTAAPAADYRRVAAALRHFGVEPAPLPWEDPCSGCALPPPPSAKLSQEEYVSGEGGRPVGHYRSAGCFCPACGEYHSCTTPLPEQSTDDGLYFFPMTCDTCGATWFDVLRLVGYSGLHNENGQEIPEKGERAGDPRERRRMSALTQQQYVEHVQQPDDPPDDIDPATGRPYGW